MNTGEWNIEVNMNSMPQKIATAFAEVNETLTGAEYEMIAYLGSQVVNGTNHAVLARQIVTTGRDNVNIVVMIFNEKPGDAKATLIGIERILESGTGLGGTTIDVRAFEYEDRSDESSIWYHAFEGLVGISLRPIVYLGNQLVNGMSHIYAATMEDMTLKGVKKAVVVTINPMTMQATTVDMLETRQALSLKYTFTW